MNRFAILWVLAGCAGDPGVDSIKQAACSQTECCPGSPIVIDVAGDGVHLTDWENGVTFALRPGYSNSQISWTQAGSDDAWLVLDRNHNGTIDNGGEMFGNFTDQMPDEGEKHNGFVALRDFDSNDDGVLDAEDDYFSDLRLWQDKNHDGISQPDELHTLNELGVTGISTVYQDVGSKDAYGNNFRYSGSVYASDGSRVGMTAYDVWLTGIGQKELGKVVSASTLAPPQTAVPHVSAPGYPTYPATQRCQAQRDFFSSSYGWSATFRSAYDDYSIPFACNNACAGTAFPGPSGSTLYNPNPWWASDACTESSCTAVCQCKCTAAGSGGGGGCT
jgi:hypothetical protein